MVQEKDKRKRKKYIIWFFLLLCAMALLISLLVIYLLPTIKPLPTTTLTPTITTTITLTPTPTITPTPTPIPPIATNQQDILIPSDSTMNAEFGNSVDINSNGDVIVVGGPGQSPNGATWVYVRSGTTWFQQTLGLVATGSIGGNQGTSVAISKTESNTILTSSSGDNSGVGATWVFVQSSQVWNQQAELIGTGYSGSVIQQGYSVSLSADGNTALTGGILDNNLIGATWVFVRSTINNNWSQQGPKLVGTGYSGSQVEQGSAVHLSDDGNTALIGGDFDNASIGATWVFVRTISSWSQQGSKLVGLGYSGLAVQQGISVCLSGDGNTALIGGSQDNNVQGAAWIFVRSLNQTWNQQGNKLVASDGIAGDQFGSSVSLNQNGNIAVIGAENANFSEGQFYVFVRSNQFGNQSNWSQQGVARVATGVSQGVVGISIAISSDGLTTVTGATLAGNGQGAAIVFV